MLYIFFLDKNTPPASPQIQQYGTLKGLEQSMNPQLMKYGRETDMSIAHARRENRLKLFSLYPLMNPSLKLSLSSPNQAEPYREIFGQRLLLKCESIKFKLQAVDEKENLCQVCKVFVYYLVCQDFAYVCEQFSFLIGNLIFSAFKQNRF